MKKICMFLISVYFVAASLDSPNVIHQKIPEKHALIKDNISKSNQEHSTVQTHVVEEHGNNDSKVTQAHLKAQKQQQDLSNQKTVHISHSAQPITQVQSLNNVQIEHVKKSNQNEVEKTYKKEEQKRSQKHQPSHKNHTETHAKVHHNSQKKTVAQRHQSVQKHHKAQLDHETQHHSAQSHQVAQGQYVARRRHSKHKSRLHLKSQSIFKLPNNIVKADIEGLENGIVEMLKAIDVGKINVTTTVVLNKYVDKMFDYLREIIMETDMDTVPLHQEKIKLRHTGHCKLIRGTLKNISTIHRTEDAFISYNAAEKKVNLGFPFMFSDLKIHYDYHVKSLLFKSHGDVNGFIKNVKFHPVFSYYYKSDKLTLDHFDIKHKGQLTVKFSGHKLVDWIINPLSKAFTHIYHRKMVNTLQHHVQTSVQKGIRRINDSIAKKIHKK